MNKHKSFPARTNQGFAVITVVIFFVIISTTVAVGLSAPVAREYVTARDFEKSKGAYYLSEAGSEDAIYRIKKSKTISAQEVIFLGGNTATTTITIVSASQKSVSSLGDIMSNTRRVKSTLTTSSGESFSYGVQAGGGGIRLENSSSINGNLFSVGPIFGTNNVVTGTVISGGVTGLDGTISGIVNQGGSSMYAGTITNSTISGSAYCNTSTGSNKTCQTLTPQIAGELPISATEIANYETAAAAGGTATCSGEKYQISGTVSIGPKKIPCKLEIKGSAVVTLDGPIWVTDDIEIENSAKIKVNPTFINESVAVVADNPSNRTTSSKIIFAQTAEIVGAPSGNSWIMFLSENTSASLGGSENAIELRNSVTGDILLYSRLGNILIQNNAALKEVTGYKITLQNSASVTYTSGLENVLFTSGPSGTWTVQNWKEGE